MTEVVTIPRAEYEKLLAEVAALRKEVEELSSMLLPVKIVLERLPHLMADIQVFKVAAPLISMLSIMDMADINAMGAAMQGGVTCTSKALRQIAENGAPKVGLFGLLNAMRDPEVQKAMGLMLTILKSMGSCMEENLKQVSEKSQIFPSPLSPASTAATQCVIKWFYLEQGGDAAGGWGGAEKVFNGGGRVGYAHGFGDWIGQGDWEGGCASFRA